LRRRQSALRTYGEKALDYRHMVTPIAIEVGSDLIPLVEGAEPGTLSDELASSVTDMRTRVRKELGVNIPGVRVRGNETDLPGSSYIVMVDEIPVGLDYLPLDRRLCIGSDNALAALNIEGEPASDPVTGQRGFWIERKDWDAFKSKDLRLWGPVEYLTRQL